MKPLMLGVFDDLRARRLLPVAAIMLVALGAVPLLMLKPADPVPATPAPTAAVTGSGAAAGGLPSAEDALQGEKRLVSLAVLQQPSDLESFKSKDPFKPPKSLVKVSAVGAPPSGAQSASADGGGSGSAGGSYGSSGGGAAPDGGVAAPGDGAPREPTPTTPSPSPNTPPQKLTYTVDLTFESPNGLRRYRSLPRLWMLPDEGSPLLVFLGVDDTGGAAVFLVDSTLHDFGGEGKCSPSPSQCATLAIEPGEVESFVDDQNRSYRIEIEEIRQTSVTSVARRARRLARRGKAAVGSDRRFLPPILTDLLTGSSRGRPDSSARSGRR